MNSCFLFPTQRNGGGNVLSSPEIIVRRTAAIGDSLAATVVADKLIERGFDVSYQTHPDCHCVIRRHPRILSVTEPRGFCHVNLDGAYENNPHRRSLHFSTMFMGVAQEQLRARGIELGFALNCRPKLVYPPSSSAAVASQLQQYRKPWVMVCPRSDSYNVRQVQDGTWADAAKRFAGTPFWLGRHPGPPNLVDMSCRHFDNVMAYLSVADLLVSVDTGPLHVAAALGVPCVALGQSSSPELHLSDQRDFITIWPKGLDCLNCQQNLCPKSQWIPPCQGFDPLDIARAVNQRLRSLTEREVSAVISVYKPTVETLNRCLQAVLPQVDEVIVVRDLAGEIPQGTLQDSKIRVVIKGERDVGYGRKANFGARHANGRYLLFLNDDCYLDPGCVTTLKEVIVTSPSIGMVAPLLLFKDGRIQHAGMVRDPNGGVCFGHIHYGKYPVEETLGLPRNVECVTGACTLVDRRAFYEVAGFREDYYLYCEDTDFCMALRRVGREIVFQPHARGIHDEHLSTQRTPNIVDIMHRSNHIFGQRWAPYFAHNRGNHGLGNFDYLR